MARIDARFELSDKRFDAAMAKIDERFERMDRRFDETIEKINAHTDMKIDRAFNELAAMTARHFRVLEKRMDTMDTHFEDIKDHLVVIDQRIGVRPEFEFSEG